MQIVNLYKYIDSNGIVITPNKRNENDITYEFRLIANENYILTNGEIETPCIDTLYPEDWSEIEYIEENNIYQGGE